MPRNQQDNPYAVIEHAVQKLKAKEYGAREDQDRKTMDEVFDRRAMLAIYKLMTEGLIESIDFPISTGKEANIFRVTSKEDKRFALKIYRTSNATFKRIARYIEADPRFHGITGNRRKVILAWATKEYRNLLRLQKAKVRVPEPIKFYQNLLLMEYIGTEQMPAPMLRNVLLEDPMATYKIILKYIRLAYQKAELVHGDLSEYNILMEEAGPVIIDVGQALTTEHPNADDYLKRDIENINRYFRSLDVKIKTTEEVMIQVKKKREVKKAKGGKK